MKFIHYSWHFDMYQLKMRSSLPWLALALTLLPYLYAGFYFDDVYNSVLRGEAIARNISVLDVVREQLKVWLTQNGRFFPLGVILGYSYWGIADTLFKARTSQILLVVLNVIFFFLMLRRSFKTYHLPAVAVIFLSTVFQFNPRWDGLSSFSPLNQLVTLFIFISWWIAIKAFDTRATIHGMWPIIGSFISVATALMIYEIGIIAWLGVLVIAIFHYKLKKDISRRLILSQIFLGALFFFTYTWFRISHVSEYEGVKTGFFSLMGPTFAAQFFSAFPLAFLSNKVIHYNSPKILLIVFFFVTFTLMWFDVLRNFMRTLHSGEYSHSMDNLITKEENLFTESRYLPWFLALLLTAVPASIIAVSDRYQKIVTYGDPYIVVYLQFFGVALFLALICRQTLLSFKSNSKLVFIAALIGAISAFTISVNYERIRAMNKDFLEPRVGMERLIKKGLLAATPPNSILVVDSPYMWEGSGGGNSLCSAFFSHHALKPLQCLGIESFLLQSNRDDLIRTREFYYLRRFFLAQDTPGIELQGGGYKITAAFMHHDAVVRDREKSDSVIIFGLGSGFYGWEPTGKSDFAWSKGASDLFFLNLSKLPHRRKISFSIQSAVDQQILIKTQNDVPLSISMKDSEIKNIEFYVDFPVNKSIIKFHPSGNSIKTGSDSRTFSFRLFNIKLH